MSWLDPLRRALDDLEQPTEVFVRDDDVGWGEERLRSLLGLLARRQLPIDLAVIPTEITPRLARWITAIGDGRVRVHQHGYRHVNHEPLGRKCEFGPSRSAVLQAEDVTIGRELLDSAFAGAVEPTFTPPWNRCDPVLGEVLVGAGFDVLSRDVSAGTLGLPALRETPVNVDWFGKSHGQRWSHPELATRLAQAVARPEPVGLMLHHELTDDTEMELVAQVLDILSVHPSARMVGLREASCWYATEPVR